MTHHGNKSDLLFSFLQMSDVHVGHADNSPVHHRLEQAVDFANVFSPAFVIDTGDVATHPVYGPEPEYLAELAEYKRYTAKLTVPLYLVPGNHDIGYPSPQGPRPTGEPWGDHTALAAAYLREFNALDQSFVHQGVRFLLVNNNPLSSKAPGYLRPEQLQWMESELRQGQRTFVFCHVEVLLEGVGEVWGESSEAMVNLCERYGVPAVAYGHRHEMHVVKRNGIQYIMCPDLKVPSRQGILEYRVYEDRFALWHHDIFTHEARLVGKYFYPIRDTS